MKVIIINGFASTGKDEFVKLFRNETTFRVKNLSSVDRVKMVAEMAFGWNGKKNNKSRKFLSDIKKAWSEFNNGPTNDIIRRIDIDIKYCLENGKKVENNVYFLHIREPKEIKKIKSIYGNNCISVLIRKNIDHIPDNDSDINVEDFKYDYIYNNKDIDDLRNCALDLYEKIKL
ncbi:MAG: hypothetical protein KDH96_12955 [Candidatus Riesia sp.]|nr:hypothetical protein [Candidatus Riesia sp.]